LLNGLKDTLKVLYYYHELPSLSLIRHRHPKKNAPLLEKQGETDGRLVVISNHLPRFDKSSADLRLYNILDIIASISRIKIHYLYVKTTAADQKYKRALKDKASPYHVPAELDALRRQVDLINPDYIWLTSLWQIDFFKMISDLAKYLKQTHPAPSIIVDTVDFHAKEYRRKYDTTNDPLAQKIACDFLKLESALYTMADKLVVVSETEKYDIEKEINNVKNISVVPNIHSIEPNSRPLDKRKHICFLGNFGNLHNQDAASYFARDIFPLIIKKQPSVEFHIIGHLSDKFRHHFKNKNIKVIGSIIDIKNALSYYRLFVCPMRFGAGLKGKIGLAIETGLPAVTTSIGAEGFPVTNGVNCFIADDPEEFSKRCLQLLSDRPLWESISRQATDMLDSEFGIDKTKNTIREILKIS
jgi:glycosyltransferase involved in cell wall biosynthesis